MSYGYALIQGGKISSTFGDFFIKGAQKTQEKLSELVLQVQVVGAVLFFEEIVADKCKMERHPFKCRDS